jgi:hypothetical protein
VFSVPAALAATTYKSQFSGRETPEGSFYPTALAVDAGGDVYVADGEHNVVDEFEASGKYLSTFNGEETLEKYFQPTALAVNASGDVYVADGANRVVDEFEPVGGNKFKLIAEFNGSAIPEDFSFYPEALAVDASGDVYVVDGEHRVVDEFSASGKYLSTFNGSETPDGLTSPKGLAVDAGGDVYVSDSENRVVDEFSASGKYFWTFNGDETPQRPFYPGGLAVHGSAVYVIEGEHGIVDRFVAVSKVPSVTIKPVTEVTYRTATFNGEVDPNGGETKYHFEDSTDGINWTSLGERSAGEGESEVPVTQTVSGLTGNSTYRVRLVAENAAGPNTSGKETFPTPTGPPEVSGSGATDITADEATLRATINPENEAKATYRIEYGPTAAYGSIGEGEVGRAISRVSLALTGLEPGTTYHFHVVASNGSGAATSTPDQTFATFSNSEAPSNCPNEQVRKESDVNPETGVPFSLQLPECRAYEMVSPLLKNGGPITAAAQTGIASGSEVSRVGAEGSTVLIKSTGVWPGGEQPANNDELSAGGSEGEQYRVTRGASGWGFMPQVPSASRLRTFSSFVPPTSTDIGRGGIWAGAGLSPDEYKISKNESPNFYLLEPGNLLEPEGVVTEIGPSVPPVDLHTAGQVGGEVQPEGASGDLSRMLFSILRLRWPFDQTMIPARGRGEIPSLYEYVGTGHTGEDGELPSLVGVDNTGALISQCGTMPGVYQEGSESGSDEPEDRAISRGGSTVFFTSRAVSPVCVEEGSSVEGSGPLVNQVFARVGEPGPGSEVGSAVTVNVAGTITTACETSDSCSVTKAVKYQGASTDGSKVFFTSEQPLVAADTDSTSNLYECMLPGDAGTPPVRSGDVDPCPDLVRVSVPVSGAGANVQSVVSVSQDGSHVYFIAKGVLTTGANAEHNSPTTGQNNLYVWEAGSANEQGHTAFIATLSSSAFNLGEVQATPDGEQLVFTSAADMTPDDTSTVSQVFLYEAAHEALIRVSAGQDGFNDDGNTATNPASIYNGASSEGRRVISEDGSTVVFESSQALTAQVHGGADNVYLWRGGNVYLISDGTLAGDQAGLGKAGLVGIDASGQNVYFTTEAQLVGQDTDELSDLYDARIDGGFPAPKVNECIGEACQGASPVALAPAMPGSLSPSGVGNFTPPTVKPTSSPKPKSLTRAEKLAKALQLCEKDKSKKKRTKCEAVAHKRYRTNAKPKTRSKRRTRTSAGRGGKR